MITFKDFLIEEGDGGAPANNSMATTGIDRYDPLLKTKKIARRKTPEPVGTVVRFRDSPPNI